MQEELEGGGILVGYDADLVVGEVKILKIVGGGSDDKPKVHQALCIQLVLSQTKLFQLDDLALLAVIPNGLHKGSRNFVESITP